MKKGIVLIVGLLATLTAIPAFAAQVRVFVAEMNAVGAQNRDEMKVTLQTLLASRLNGERIVAVGSAAEADVMVTGTYVAIGKVFSVDALARTSGGKTLTRAFVQGENQDELIPAVGKLAEKLSAELGKFDPGAPPVSASTPAASGIIKSEQHVRQAPAGEFIKPRDYEQGSSGGWVSKRLDGAANLMATGKTLPDGSREIFLAEDRRLSCYRQARDMKLVAETEFKTTEKIISLDALDTAAGMDLYVTILRGDDLASQVWQLQGDKLARVAENLPFFFRVFSPAGGPRRLYAQSMGRDRDFYGDVSEATRQGANITLKNPIRMPRFGDIYTFNQFRDRDGKVMTVVINPDNYLIVYDQELKELWRSSDKFGGSELYFQKEDLENARMTADKNRWIFMNQRIQVTARAEVLVGKNDGFWVLGNARSYKRGAVYCLVWNGSSLEEKWRTKDTQNYMPDYWLDESRNELLILQTVQRQGLTTRGASALSIKKVE